MGYSHYWHRQKTIPVATMKRIVDDVLKLPKLFDKLGDWQGKPGSKPSINPDEIVFNGIDDGCETFHVVRDIKDDERELIKEGGLIFACCKTRASEYDEYVTACLTILKHYLGPFFVVHSDGDDGDWEEGRTLMRKAGLDYWNLYRFKRTGDSRDLGMVGTMRIADTGGSK